MELIIIRGKKCIQFWTVYFKVSYYP